MLAETKPQEVGKLRCQYDSYVKEITTTVLKCTKVDEQFEVVLGDSVIFPTGGGQPNDLGHINDIPVLNSFRRGLECVHLVPNSFKIGETVTVKVDWNRRFDHMQQHSGQHLISDLAERVFGWKTFCWNLGSEKCNLEFDGVAPDQQKMQELETMVNEYIRQGHPVEIDMSESVDEAKADGLPEDITAGVLRKIKIGDIPPGPCCGTHVKNTIEVQMIKFLSIEKCRTKNTRLWFVCGNRVLYLFDQSLKRDEKLNKLLSAGPDQFENRILKIMDQRKEFMKANKKLEKELKSKAQ